MLPPDDRIWQLIYPDFKNIYRFIPGFSAQLLHQSLIAEFFCNTRGLKKFIDMQIRLSTDLLYYHISGLVFSKLSQKFHHFDLFYLILLLPINIFGVNFILYFVVKYSYNDPAYRKGTTTLSIMTPSITILSTIKLGIMILSIAIKCDI
jgi:hypothetical protein